MSLTEKDSSCKPGANTSLKICSSFFIFWTNFDISGSIWTRITSSFKNQVGVILVVDSSNVLHFNHKTEGYHIYQGYQGCRKGMGRGINPIPKGGWPIFPTLLLLSRRFLDLPTPLLIVRHLCAANPWLLLNFPLIFNYRTRAIIIRSWL